MWERVHKGGLTFGKDEAPIDKRLTTTNALSRKLRAIYLGDFTEVDSLLEGMRHLLIKHLPLEEILTAIQPLRVSNFNELKDQKESDLRLLKIQQRVRIGRGPLHFSMGKD